MFFVLFCFCLMLTLVRWSIYCFMIHTPTFVMHYCFCQVTSFASVCFVVSVPPPCVLSVVWLIAEGALISQRDLKENQLRA